MSIHRQQLLQIYHHALKAVHGRESVARYLRQHQAFDQPPAIIAIGKAAPAMMLGALDVLGEQVQQGLLITKQGLLTPNQAFTKSKIICLESNHPVPDQQSIDAGQQLITFLQNLPQTTPVICLISGGASALVEVLPDDLSLQDLQRVNQYLLSSGLDIQQMNAIRQQLSCIKGGRLANYFHPHQQTVLGLYISDVPSDDLSIIGSGLLVTPKPLDASQQTQIQHIFTELALPCTVKQIPPAHQLNIEHNIVASSRIGRLAALDMAKKLEIEPIYCADELLVGDVFEAADMIVQTLKQNAGLYIWSSETTVQLPETIGRGGRCQTLALTIAQQIVDNEHYFVLAGSTDGNDGSHLVAGALVDGDTINRGKTQGLEADEYLQTADTGSFLDVTGDLIDTGETGTNVMDLILAWRV
ncbi:DUF4147 domain-containing protein [Candidatus Albibeggiatoa sp. nov. NOAA]|uniref:glycerate kinase type-2 family protein n=1 Tax=Candidatus Albibeggiatoa sp. nov. NOAA TaxID=3162724 RepID=UPI0032F5035E|nr:DUF4147 domain-containing protein [Thiotrichaceae bacterium]